MDQWCTVQEILNSYNSNPSSANSTKSLITVNQKKWKDFESDPEYGFAIPPHPEKIISHYCTRLSGCISEYVWFMQMRSGDRWRNAYKLFVHISLITSKGRFCYRVTSMTANVKLLYYNIWVYFINRIRPTKNHCHFQWHDQIWIESLNSGRLMDDQGTEIESRTTRALFLVWPTQNPDCYFPSALINRN